jgi:4-hydroxy-tetrahydrodipicolinate synthase
VTGSRRPVITGRIVALVTPVRADSAVDRDAHERLVERTVVAGASAIVLVGMAGREQA